MTGRNAFPCGRCMPCRINKRREWQHRILLESAEYGDNAFVTLTYDDDHLPSDGCVDPQEIKNFLKRLKRKDGRSYRYFAVGEYGGQTNRPHYHLALFDFPTCFRGQTDFRRSVCCSRCELVRSAWKNGGVHLGRLEPESAAYLGGYISKRATKEGDPRLHGRSPEFARMSNRPGLGEGFAWELASTILQHDLPAVPRAILHGTKSWPLGRYIRDKASKYSEKPVAPAEVAVEVTQVFDQVLADQAFRPGQKYHAVRQALISKNIHRAEKVEMMERRKEKRRETIEI